MSMVVSGIPLNHLYIAFWGGLYATYHLLWEPETTIDTCRTINWSYVFLSEYLPYTYGLAIATVPRPTWGGKTQQLKRLARFMDNEARVGRCSV